MRPGLSLSTCRGAVSLLIISVVLLPGAALATSPENIDAPVAPPTSVLVEDYRYDNGEALQLLWVPSINDALRGGEVDGYKVYRSCDGDAFVEVATLPAGTSAYLDEQLNRHGSYRYYVSAVVAERESPSVTTMAISPQVEWINFGRASLFIVACVIGASVIFFISRARGRKLYVRRIAGLEAVDEAIGRSTEMGRPILFIPGINDLDDVETLASLTILGRVAQQVAVYDTKIRMPVARSLVMTAARETIRTAYQAAGRPDAYSDDMANYVTDEQFGYVAAVDGIMVREKPAACFLLGAFYAESLILAETGNSVGAIQIAGTAQPAQLPFFVAACDFTLIGEELFAASAYLSGEPRALGSLKGQDAGKAMAMAAIAVGVAVSTIGALWNIPLVSRIAEALQWFFTAK